MGDAIDTNVKFKRNRSQNECFKSYFMEQMCVYIEYDCLNLCVYLHYIFLLVVSACTWSLSNSCTTHFCRSSKRDIFTIVNAFGASVVAVLISSYHQEQVQSMRFTKIHNNKWERKKSASLRVSAYKWIKMKRKIEWLAHSLPSLCVVERKTDYFVVYEVDGGSWAANIASVSKKCPRANIHFVWEEYSNTYTLFRHDFFSVAHFFLRFNQTNVIRSCTQFHSLLIPFFNDRITQQLSRFAKLLLSSLLFMYVCVCVLFDIRILFFFCRIDGTAVVAFIFHYIFFLFAFIF